MIKPVFFFLTYFIIALSFTSCRNKTELINADKNQFDFKYQKKTLRYDLGDNITRDVEVYISSDSDTIANQYISYKDNKVDSTNSLFYVLNYAKNTKTNKLKGKINFHYDPKTEGKLEHFLLRLETKIGDTIESLDLKNYDFKDNSIGFEINHDNDTIMGIIHTLFSKEPACPLK